MVVLLRSQASRVVSRVLMSRHSVYWEYQEPQASFKNCLIQEVCEVQRDKVRVLSLAAIQKTMVGCARARSTGRWHVSVGGAVSEKRQSTAEQ